MLYLGLAFNRRRIVFESTFLIIIGVIILVILLNFNGSIISYLTSGLYILTGVIGLISYHSEKKSYVILFQISLVLLIIGNASISVFLLYYAIVVNLECRRCTGEGCTLGCIIVLVLYIAIIMSAFLAFVISVFFKHARTYYNDLQNTISIR